MALHRAAYDTSAPNAKRKYPDEGEADEEEIEEYKVRKRAKGTFLWWCVPEVLRKCVCILK